MIARYIPIDRQAKGLGSRQFTSANSEYLTIASSPVTTMPVSYSMWFRADEDNPVADRYVFYHGNSGSTNEWFSISVTTSGFVRSWIRNALFLDSANDYADLKWHHILTSVWDVGSRRHIAHWIDGVADTPVDTGNEWLITGFDTIAIGMLRDSSPAAPYNGKVTSVAMWNAQMGIGDAKKLYSGQHPRDVRGANLKFYTRLPASYGGVRDEIGGLWLSDNATVTQSSSEPALLQNRLWTRNRRVVPVVAAGLSIPVAMHHYTKNIRVA